MHCGNYYNVLHDSVHTFPWKADSYSAGHEIVGFECLIPRNNYRINVNRKSETLQFICRLFMNLPGLCICTLQSGAAKLGAQTYEGIYIYIFFFFSVALQSLKYLGRLTCRRFLELFRHMVGLLGQVISPSQGLYLHRTIQHGKTWTNIHALIGIRTHDPSSQPAKTHASDRTATVTGIYIRYIYIYIYAYTGHLFFYWYII
jgi:hypothetical protein